MPDESVKQRLRRAIHAVRSMLDSPPGMYRIIELSDSTCPFHLERWRNHAEKGDEVWKVRVCLDQITDYDFGLCKGYNMPGKIFTKLIVCKRPGNKEYETVEL